MSVYRPTYKDPKTGDLKESAVWWYEFTFAGKRIRESSKVTRKTLAQMREKERRLELERAITGITPKKAASIRISGVAEVLNAYSNAFSVGHRKKSLAVVNERSAHLIRILGPLLVADLSDDRMIEYMRQRQSEGASGRTINLEISVLSRALGRTWNALWPNVRRLEENRDIGRALSPQEETAIMDAAARSKSPMVFTFLQLLARTGVRSDEARTMRWSQLDLSSRTVTVGKSKTSAGAGRIIPIGGRLLLVLQHHASWYAQHLGPIQPDWYVFPSCDRVKPVDATRPITSFKRAWESIRKKAAVECRLHDLRHTFCTQMAEAGVAEATMLDMMGHMSAEMLRRYSHIRAKAREEAIAAIEARANVVPKESPKVDHAAPIKATVTH